jgi:hypothetical protein
LIFSVATRAASSDAKSWTPFLLSFLTDVASRALSEKFSVLSPGQKAEVTMPPGVIALALMRFFSGVEALRVVCLLLAEIATV